MNETQLLLARSDTEAPKLAGSICHHLRAQGNVQVRGIGAGAVNAMVKALIIANGIMASTGQAVESRPFFVDLGADANKGRSETTAVQFRITVYDL